MSVATAVGGVPLSDGARRRRSTETRSASGALVDGRQAGVRDGGGDRRRRRVPVLEQPATASAAMRATGARLAPANDPNAGSWLGPSMGSRRRCPRGARWPRRSGRRGASARALSSRTSGSSPAANSEKTTSSTGMRIEPTCSTGVALVRHRPRRRLEPREGGDERGEVDARPVALDEEGRERGWIARSVHAADDGRAASSTKGAITPISRSAGALAIAPPSGRRARPASGSRASRRPGRARCRPSSGRGTRARRSRGW